MDNLKAILEKILKTNSALGSSYKEHELKARVFEAWPRVVGERVTRHCWPIGLFDKGVLLIGAESNAWLHSLRYLEAQILQKYEKELGSKKVTALRFKLDTRRP